MIPSLYQAIRPYAVDAIEMTSVSSLNLVSHAIEEVAHFNAPGSTLLAGFQRFSAFMRQEQRYRALAHTCEQIWVHGQPDLQPQPIDRLGYIPLEPGAPLASEWFLIINAPSFCVALIARELEATAGERSFQAFLTSGPETVGRACALFDDSPAGPYPIPGQYNLIQRHENLMQVLRRLIQHQERRAGAEQPRPPQISASPSAPEQDPATIVRELEALLPAFADREDWLRLLQANIRRTAAQIDAPLDPL